MDIKSIATIWRKELRDTIRDRRTMVSMILIPMLLMPAVMIGMIKFIQSQETKNGQQVIKMAIEGKEYAPDLAEAIGKLGKFEIVQADGDIKEAVTAEKLDAALIIPHDFSSKLDKEEPVKISLISKSTNLKASSALVAVSSAVGDFNNNLLQERFGAQHINQSILSNVAIDPIDAATQKEVGGLVLGFIIPIFIVMWSIIGGQYTAIDVSAGEKERKTLEALLLTPVKRIDIVAGKFLAVSTVAVISIIAAISSLYFSFTFAGKSGIPLEANLNASSGATAAAKTGFNFSVEPQAALLLFAVSLFLVLMFSAIILSISIFAKSFKEAESYISPAYIIVVLPVVFVNAVPGFEPTLAYFAVPAVNAILLFKEILIGTYDWAHIALTLGSLAVYSLAAVFIASKIYSKESVLFND